MLGAVLEIGDPCQSPFNAGFLTHLYLIRTDDVVFVLPPQSGSITQALDSIGIHPGASIAQFLIRPKTATFSEGSSTGPDGTSFSAAISFPMKGTVPGLTTWIHQNANRRFVILTRDTLGNCYVAGSNENGARISWGRQIAQTSQHQVSLAIVSWHPAQFIPVIDLDQLFPDSEFDYSFDSSFS